MRCKLTALMLVKGKLATLTGGTQKGIMLPGPGRAPCATGPHLAGSCQPHCTLLPFSHACYISPSFFSPILLISLQADPCISKVSVSPQLKYGKNNQEYGHLPLQHYQSRVNSLGVPLSKLVTFDFLSPMLLYPSHFAKAGPCRQPQ